MFPISIRSYLKPLLLALIVSVAWGQDRKIKSVVNPGCKACTVNQTLVYIQAVGSNDTIHQIWDFTRGYPTVMLAVGGVNSTLNISWDGTKPRRFNFSEQPKYGFAAFFDELYEYDDIADRGYIEPDCPHYSYSLSTVRWRRNYTLTDKEATLAAQGDVRGGTVEIQLNLIPYVDYASQLPHLIHTANSTLWDVTLVNLTTHPAYNASRFALQFVLASTEGNDDTFHYNMRKSLDDEHTPGVFEIVEIKSPQCYSGGAGGYVQFRPVAYTGRQRGVTTSTIARMTDQDGSRIPSDSGVSLFFRSLGRSKPLVAARLVSFGEPGDGYYRQHNYTAWSFSMGYGTPPLEGFSPFVIGIIAAGLGVPVLLAMSGIVYVLVRRRKQRARNEPTRFTDEE